MKENKSKSLTCEGCKYYKNPDKSLLCNKKKDCIRAFIMNGLIKDEYEK